jgi:hypothetical protein
MIVTAALILGAIVCGAFAVYNAGLLHRSTPALATTDGQELSDEVLVDLLRQAEQQGHRPSATLSATRP